jgi:hypothetical protein
MRVALVKACAPLRRLASFFERLTAAFGWRYVTAVLLTYGVNQGAGEALLEAVTDYYLIDYVGLQALQKRCAGLRGYPGSSNHYSGSPPTCYRSEATTVPRTC